MEQDFRIVCPFCKSQIRPNQKVVICPNCNVAYHDDCWEASEGCVVDGCGAKDSDYKDIKVLDTLPDDYILEAERQYFNKENDNEKPVAEEHTVEEIADEEPVAEEHTVEEIVEEPVVEEPTVEEIAEEESVVEEPTVEEIAEEKPVVEEPTVEEIADEEPVVEEPTAEEIADEEPVAEDAQADVIDKAKPNEAYIPAEIQKMDYNSISTEDSIFNNTKASFDIHNVKLSVKDEMLVKKLMGIVIASLSVVSLVITLII